MTLKLLLATGNLKKLKEIEEILKDLPVECLTLRDFPGIREVEETGKTFEENAGIKALGYAGQTGLLTLGEDSGICCDALDGAPGVFSARFCGESKSDDANNEKLLAMMNHVPEGRRTAYYESSIALAEPGKLVGVVKGQVHGMIARSLSGSGGFGYDPLFFYPPFGKTFGEVSSEMKHSVSHRGQALGRFRALFQEYLKRT
jgi:non-canonical purine NTP pyrophosphatase (RdgB/HAM1 family)